jgi:hypothetical protein
LVEIPLVLAQFEIRALDLARHNAEGNASNS